MYPRGHLQNTYDMALFKYLRRVDELPIESMKHTITDSEIVKNTEKKPEGKKRGEYNKLSQKDKAMIGRYASEHGVTKAVKHYSEKNVKESSVRDWKRLYEKELKNRCKEANLGEVVVVDALPSKK